MSYGPIELLMLEHDGGRMPAGVVSVLKELTASGFARIVDIAFVTRDEDGSVRWGELPDVEPALVRLLDPLVAEIAGLVSHEDLADLGRAVTPGRTAVVVVLEHRWPAHLDAAARKGGAALTLHLRIPRDAVDEAAADHAVTG